jgi:hypothetical protein
MPDQLTILSGYHGERLWTRVCDRKHVRPGRKPVRLAVWQADCAVCGAPYEVATRRHPTSSEPRFSVMTCRLHRLTPKERGRLAAGDDDRRRAVFDEIKRAKLAREGSANPGAK